jgi:hypothetical protein
MTALARKGRFQRIYRIVSLDHPHDTVSEGIAKSYE